MSLNVLAEIDTNIPRVDAGKLPTQRGCLSTPQKARPRKALTPFTQSTAPHTQSTAPLTRCSASTPGSPSSLPQESPTAPRESPAAPRALGRSFEESGMIQEVDHGHEPAERSRKSRGLERQAWMEARLIDLPLAWSHCRARTAPARHAMRVAVIELTRHPKAVDQLLKRSQLAAGLADITPAWANGAKVLVPGFGPGDAWETRVSFGQQLGLGRSHVVVYERDAEALMAELRQKLPWEDRPTERRARRHLIPDARDDELFADSGDELVTESKVVIHKTFYTVVPVQPLVLTRAVSG